MKKIEKEKLLKVYRFRIDMEDKNGYSENMDSFDILDDSFEKAVEEAKQRIARNKNYIIGEVELISVLS